MKRQHKQPEAQSPLALGDAQLDFAGQPVGAAGETEETEFLKKTRSLTACAPYPAPVVTLVAPEGNAWWDEEEPDTRTGGVCLLIA